jgi:excisionase family DNA binding protein
MADKEYLSIREVCEAFNVDYKTIYRRVQSGELPSSRIGWLYRIKYDDVVAFMNRERATRATTQTDAPEAALATERIELLRPDDLEAMRQDRLADAREQLNRGEIDTLMTARQAKLSESNILNRFDRKLHELVNLRAPDGSLIKISDVDRYVSRCDATSALMNALGVGFVEQSLLDRLPLNECLKLDFPADRQRTGRFALELRVISDLRAYADDGFVVRRSGLDALLPLLAEVERAARGQKGFHVIALAATAGWDAEARAHVFDAAQPTKSYTHGHVIPMLIDLAHGHEIVYHTADSRAQPYAGLFAPQMKDERVAQAMRDIEATLLVYDGVAAEELPKLTGAPAEIVEAAVARLVAAKRVRQGEIKGMGTVIQSAS